MAELDNVFDIVYSFRKTVDPESREANDEQYFISNSEQLKLAPGHTLCRFCLLGLDKSDGCGFTVKRSLKELETCYKLIPDTLNVFILLTAGGFFELTSFS